MSMIISDSGNHDAAGWQQEVATLDAVGRGSPPKGGDIWAKVKKTGKEHHAEIPGQGFPGREA